MRPPKTGCFGEREVHPDGLELGGACLLDGEKAFIESEAFLDFLFGATDKLLLKKELTDVSDAGKGASSISFIFAKRNVGSANSLIKVCLDMVSGAPTLPAFFFIMGV